VDDADTVVRMPLLGQDATEATVAHWFKRVGDPIRLDEPLLEASTDKAEVEIVSTATGVIRGILVMERQAAAVGEALAIVEPQAHPALSVRVPTARTLVLHGHKGWGRRNPGVRAVAFSPDGLRLATGGGDRTVRIWDTADGRLLHTLTGHTGSVNSVGFSPDGRLLASGAGAALTGGDGGDGAGGTDGPEAPGRRPADKTVKVWDPASGTLIRTLVGHGGSVNALAFGPDGRYLVSAGSDGVALVWTAAGTLVHTLSGNAGPMNAVAFSPGGRLVATADGGRTVRFWDVGTGAMAGALGQAQVDPAMQPGHPTELAFSPDGDLLVTAMPGPGESELTLWDPRSGERVAVFSARTAIVHAVTFSPDSQVIASAGSDATTKLWDRASGALIRTLTGHGEPVTSVAFSADGRRLASASLDRTAMLWA
jgi:WD40 repeat protein